jgi:hypothetical protein
MTTLDDSSTTSRLPGCIYFYTKGRSEYANYETYIYDADCNKEHSKEYLGKVIKREEYLFYNYEKGFFNFTLEKGYTLRPDLDIDNDLHESLRLRYGDIWVYEEILRTTGLYKITNSLISDYHDTLNALLAFRLCYPEASYCYAENWYDRSFAKVIYPKAALSSSSISKFLAKIGDEFYYRDFTSLYLSFITQDRNLSEMVDFPVLIDSTGMPNSSKIEQTAVNNHSGVVSNEIRLIYVVDSDSGLPIFFKPISGNIIDNSTLKTTINILEANNIYIKAIVMDAGYSSLGNLRFLQSLDLPFITRLNENLTVYKKIINEHSEDLLKNPINIIKQNKREIFCKQIKIQIEEYYYFAYLCIDIDKFASEFKNGCKNIPTDKDNNIDLEAYNNKMNKYGRFILLSKTDIDPKDIVGKYYIRQKIEQIFDVSKNNASLLPVRCHSDETLRGHILINFIVTVIHLLINNKLKDSILNSEGIFIVMNSLYINIYPSKNIIEVPTSKESDIIEVLNLETPYEIDKRAKQNPKLKALSAPRKRGRPQGSSKKDIKYKEVEASTEQTEHLPVGFVRKSDSDNFSREFEPARRRGRPKGSPNKPKAPELEGERSDTTPGGEETKPARGRGRPKGSLNKPKAPEIKGERSDTTPGGEETKPARGRGRPKGSRNKPKAPEGEK